MLTDVEMTSFPFTIMVMLYGHCSKNCIHGETIQSDYVQWLCSASVCQCVFNTAQWKVQVRLRAMGEFYKSFHLVSHL